MLAIPNELMEAAKLDGAGSLRIFWSIVLPLCKPLLAVLTLLALMYQWNDFLWPLIALKDPDLYTLPIGLQFLQGQYQTDYGALMAMTLIAVAPAGGAVPGLPAVLRAGPGHHRDPLRS